MFPRVSIIILNWNGWRDTVECLESVYRIDYPNYDVIVVDNASYDESIQKIKEYARGKLKVKSKFFDYNPENKPIKIFELSEEEALQGKFNRPLYEKYDPDRRLILIKNRNNYGYAGGNNKGIQFALGVLNPEFILILNNDVVVDKKFLNVIIQALKLNPETGIAGPKVYYYDYNGRSDIIHSVGAKILLEKGTAPPIGINTQDTGQFDSEYHPDYVEGSCMVLKSSMLNSIGLFDNTFFAYWEETDLCIRAKKKGYEILYVPYSKVWHKVSSSWKKKNNKKIYLETRNRIIFLKKHLPSKKFCKYILTYFVIQSIIFLIKSEDITQIITYLKAVKDALTRNPQDNTTL